MFSVVFPTGYGIDPHDAIVKRKEELFCSSPEKSFLELTTLLWISAETLWSQLKQEMKSSLWQINRYVSVVFQRDKTWGKVHALQKELNMFYAFFWPAIHIKA